MADTIGMYIRVPKWHQETVKPDYVNPIPTIVRTPVIPLEPPPALSSPAPQQALEPVPQLTVPAAIALESPPTLTSPIVIALEPPPELSTAQHPAFEDPPTLDVPAQIGTEPPPVLSTPEKIPTEPAPVLTVPVTVGFEPAPDITRPGAVPLQPTPDHDVPVSIAPEPTPVLSIPSEITRKIIEIDDRRHSDDPAVRSSEKGTGSGILSQLASVDLGVNTSISVPGLGLVPLDSHVSTHGGKVEAGFDLHLKDALSQRAKQLKGAAADAASRFAVTNAQNVSKNVTDQLSSIAGGRVRDGGPSLVPFTVPDTFKRDSLIQGSNSDLSPVSPVSSSKATVEAQAATGYNLRTRLNIYDEYARSQDWIPDAIDLRQLNDPKRDESTKQENLRRLYQGTSVSMGSFNDPLKGPLSNLKNIFRSQGGGSDLERGFFRVETANDSKRERDLPSDNEAYVPVVFTDLRPLQGGVYRSVYFRPFLTALSEELQPQWNMQGYFGRVDPVATYQSTNRMISMGFKIVTFSPEELMVNYKKLSWLKSMVYPQYDHRMQYRAGPVVRLRVGDIINALGKEGNRGLAGVITSLSFDYGNATWELLNDRHVPREIEVSVSFHVLHDTPIGLLDGTGPAGNETQFGGIENGKSGADYRRFHTAFGKNDYLNAGKGIKIDPVPNDISGSGK